MSEYRFNVAQLLQEPTGATRRYELDDEQLDLGDGRRVRPVKGHVRLTRTQTGVLADVDVRGQLQIECARCLTEINQPLEFPFSEEFYQTVAVNTGVVLPKPEEPDVFLINEVHMLDLGDAMREYALLNVPMVPLCRADCKGLCPECGANLNDEVDHTHAEQVDDRLAALRQLLDQPE
ncbi:MAG: DUF177 domain-containing protein [Chloroflexota bacterium]|nr:DUF177 domain-containing protein [Chloroflexota bacterium]